MKLTIEKLPSSVPPVDCVYQDGEEATFRIYRENSQSEKAVVCNDHLRKYLLDVLEKL